MPINESNLYKSLAERLNKKCQELHLCNEQSVHRINKIKKIMRRRKRDVSILKGRLDRFKDNWRAVPRIMATAPHPKRKIEQKRGPKPKFKPTSTIFLPKSPNLDETVRTEPQQNQP